VAPTANGDGNDTATASAARGGGLYGDDTATATASPSSAGGLYGDGNGDGDGGHDVS